MYTSIEYICTDIRTVEYYVYNVESVCMYVCIHSRIRCIQV